MFGIGFAVEVDPEFAGSGGEAPQRMPQGLPRIGAILRITPRNAAAWDIAVGASNWWRSPIPTAIAVISDGHGLVIDVSERRVLVDVTGVIRITEDERDDLLLLVTRTDLTAVSADGVAWRSGPLALDDLKVVAIEARGIVCTGASSTELAAEIVIDPGTGHRV